MNKKQRREYMREYMREYTKKKKKAEEIKEKKSNWGNKLPSSFYNSEKSVSLRSTSLFRKELIKIKEVYGFERDGEAIRFAVHMFAKTIPKEESNNDEHTNKGSI